MIRVTLFYSFSFWDLTQLHMLPLLFNFVDQKSITIDRIRRVPHLVLDEEQEFYK